MNDNRKPVLLVTGGTGGIGGSTADQWAAAGGRVAILDLSPEAVRAKVDELGTDVAVGIPADVRDDAAVTDAVRAAAERFDGRLDAVVNCAGIAQPIIAAEGADEDWVRMIDIHLNGHMRVNRAAHQYLTNSDRAAVVNISSIAGSVGLPGRTNYGAAKSGIEGLTRGLAVEWSPDIRVNCVAPGYVRTPMIDRLVSDGKLDAAPVIARTPLDRFADPAEIAAAIMFLLSPQASFITGQTLRVDGGLTIEGDWYASRQRG
ncbi:SDR family NAD(P)-dependent oxidoreductase [Nocardia sp. NPDC058518]|uniref:SDR family NAD(P)-dependent oxidoreductase n=1 Tax=Nocardia sp. NPDC058518 TaxID=3346534 RepID=UPI00365F9EE9